MNTEQVYAITKRAPGRWRVWTACFLMAFDVFFLPTWIMVIAAELTGHHGPTEIGGQVVPLWFVLVLGIMSILSVVGIAAIAYQTNAIGFRIATAVAVGWVAFFAVTWLAGVWTGWAIAGRLVILGLLIWGRGPFLPEPTAPRVSVASTS